jgi:hypothetical protein
VSGAYYFSTAPDGVVHLMARLESESDEPMIGDVHHELKPGEVFLGISFVALQKAGSGIVEVDDNGARIKRS